MVYTYDPTYSRGLLSITLPQNLAKQNNRSQTRQCLSTYARYYVILQGMQENCQEAHHIYMIFFPNSFVFHWSMYLV